MSSKKCILLDYEGTIFKRNEFIPDSHDFIKDMKQAGFDVKILSNSSRLSTSDFCGTLTNAGITEIAPADIINGQKLTISVLKQKNHKTIFALGNEGFINELKEAGIKVIIPEDHENKSIEEVKLFDVEAVVVAVDDKYDFLRISYPTRYAIEQKVPFYSVGKDRFFPTERADQFIPGSYTLINPVATASFIEPIIIGKPNPETITNTIDLSSYNEIYVVGDNSETDVAFAHSINAKSVLVLTGYSTDANIETYQNEQRPTYVCNNLTEAKNIILK